MRSLILVPLTVVAIAAAGCGGDDTDTTAAPATTATTATGSAPAASTPAPEASTPSPTTAAPAGGTVRIGMKNLQFAPRDVTVQAGTTVTWTNQEDFPHNVVAEKGADFASDTFGKDGTYTWKADAPGVVTYICTIHPGMEGTLTVEG